MMNRISDIHSLFDKQVKVATIILLLLSLLKMVYTAFFPNVHATLVVWFFYICVSSGWQ